LLGRRGYPERFCARALQVATEPQDVFGAATRGGHLHKEITSGYEPDCRRRQALDSGKIMSTIRSQEQFVS